MKIFDKRSCGKVAGTLLKGDTFIVETLPSAYMLYLCIEVLSDSVKAVNIKNGDIETFTYFSQVEPVDLTIEVYSLDTEED